MTTFVLGRRDIIRVIHGITFSATSFPRQGLRGIRGSLDVAIAFPPDRIHRSQAGLFYSLWIFPRVAPSLAKITQIIIGYMVIISLSIDRR